MVMLALSLGMLLVVVVAMALMRSVLDTDSSAVILWTQAATQLLTFLLPVVLTTAIYYGGEAREYYRLRFGRREWLLALSGVAATLLLVPADDWLAVWNDGWNLGRVGETLRAMQDQTEGIVESMMATDTVRGLIANLIVVALVPAVCEEVFFRAGIQNLLQRWFGNSHAAIWVTALIFSLGHGEVFSFMPRFVLGAMLGYLYVYGGSILINATAHFVNNALVVLLYWLAARGVLGIDPSEPLHCNALLTVCCTLAAAGVVWVSFFAEKTKNKPV